MKDDFLNDGKPQFTLTVHTLTFKYNVTKITEPGHICLWWLLKGILGKHHEPEAKLGEAERGKVDCPKP